MHPLWVWLARSLAGVGWSAGRLVPGSPMHDAVSLGLRLIGARTMSLATLIAAALLIRIEEFAEFGVYQVLAALVWTATFLRYDAAIVAALSEKEAEAALKLSLVIGTAVWIGTSVVAVAAGGAGWFPPSLAFLFPLSTLGRLIMRLAFAATTRDGDFKTMGRASLVQSIFQPMTLLALIGLGSDGAEALAGADIVGHITGAAYLTWHRRRYFGAFAGKWSGALLHETAHKWKNLPLYNLPGSFLPLAFVSSPLLIMPLTANAFFAGQVALAFRIFDVPTQIITAASTPIFLNRLRPSEEGINPIFRRRILVTLSIALAMLYGAVAGLIALADDYVLQGTALAHLAGVVTIVAAFQLFVALSAPLNDSCALYPQQRRLLLVNGLAVAGSIVCALLSGILTPRAILIALAVLSCIRVVALGELLRKLSRLNRRSPAVAPAVEISAP